MIRRPPRSTQSRSSAASDVYKRQVNVETTTANFFSAVNEGTAAPNHGTYIANKPNLSAAVFLSPVSYTHLRAHETVLDLVCRLLLEKKKTNATDTHPL